MNWLLTSINWYIYLLVLGIIFLPLTQKIFGKVFFDFGYPFSKAIAILFLSYALFLLSFLKILEFNRINLFLLLGIALIINLYLYFKEKQVIKWNIVIFEEILFLLAFIFWIIVRGQEPSIRGLEKFMDFGFINSILRSKYLPPLDIWLSADPINPHGFPINYYYFGHLTGAFLIRLSGTIPTIGYNLILTTLFALGITQVFSFCANIACIFLKKIKKITEINFFPIVLIGLLGAFLVNLSGNLHTVYLFTTGYPNDNPIPFWQILSSFNPTKYWYPNATRFIPFTIHEFPSYSYVVADLHGHVFDIPFVLLTLAILFKFFIDFKLPTDFNGQKIKNKKLKMKNHNAKILSSNISVSQYLNFSKLQTTNYTLLTTIFLGFLTAVHYMTNAFDGPIYLLLTLIIFFFIFKLNLNSVFNAVLLILSFFLFSLPFSSKFQPFVSGIGVNCSPGFLVKIGKIGPFLFENNKCQSSPLWMLFVLWGFFWISFILFLFINYVNKQHNKNRTVSDAVKQLNNFFLILFSFSTFLIFIPEFFYIKDIYPAHFRANTMFKLGYQAFIMMSIASSYVFFRIKSLKNTFFKIIMKIIFIAIFFFVAIYPFFTITSFYGTLARPVELDGSKWLINFYPEDKEIVEFFNQNIHGQSVIAEAQGDSYTDYERISSYTGLPTIAGWWVHEWLWRGSSDIVGKRIPDIVNLYESNDLNLTKEIIKKYQLKYVVISDLEKQKYKNINIEKFAKLGRLIFRSSNQKGTIYQLN